MDTRRVTRRVLLACACALLVAPPAAAARVRPQVLAYTITGATMTEQLSFQGDGGPACARAGVCGYSGDVTYQFGGIQDGDATLLVVPLGHRVLASGLGVLQANGLTRIAVSGPGGGPPCSEAVIHRSDHFDISGNRRALQLSFHSPDFAPDYLTSYCVGPDDADIWSAHALPRPSFPFRWFQRKRLRLDVSSSRAFHSGPFVGTVSFSASIRLKRTRANDLVQLIELLQSG